MVMLHGVGWNGVGIRGTALAVLDGLFFLAS